LELEELVEQGLETGASARKIAEVLDVDRGRVDRVVKRLKKRAASAEAEAEQAADPSSVQQMLDEVDGQIRTAIAVGNDLRAKRLTGVRASLVEQLPIQEVHDGDVGDTALLSEAEFSALRYLVAKMNRVEPDVAATWWGALFERVPPALTST